ncbi:SGNH/GDSL hydrolase family protein [Enterococcus sp. LJL98]
MKKNWVAFGDSVTWYDQKQFLAFTRQPNQKCQGYQTHLEQELEIKIENQGISGNTVQDVCQRSLNFDYAHYQGVSFFVGINNFNKMSTSTFGQIEEKGHPFDASTFCGAYQTMIEDVLNRAPHVQILLIIPYKVFKQTHGELPAIYSQTIRQIAQLYGLPFCDLYTHSPIDPLDVPQDFVDDFNLVHYYFHLNNEGYKKIATLLIPFFKEAINQP